MVKINQDIVKGMRIGLGFALVLILILGIGYAGTHLASQVIPGTFIGNFIFQGNTTFNGSVTLNDGLKLSNTTQLCNLTNVGFIRYSGGSFDLCDGISWMEIYSNSSDIYWSSVVFGMHFDGVDGGTTFTDLKSHNIFTAGNVQTSTVQYKFSGSSVKFDGNGDYLYLNGSSDLSFPNDYTVEWWVYFNTVPNGTAWNSLINNYVDTSTGNFDYEIYNKKIYFYTNGAGGVITGITNLTSGQWYHMAVTRQGSTCRIFLNGNLEGTRTESNVHWNSSQTIYIGWRTGGGDFNGYIDDLRITKGVARYTSNFTTPVYTFPNK